jgi:murein DD-endopeptidase MepM/ murein hydrolase activator NlpD
MPAMRGGLLLAGAAILGLCAPASVSAQPLGVTHTARSLRPGEVVLLTITTSTPASRVRVRAFERDWPAFQDDDRHWSVLIGIGVETKPGTYRAVVAADGASTAYPLAVLAHAFRTRRLTVDPDLVNPPPEAMARVEREARELNALWDQSNAARLWAGPFVPPVPEPANSAFGTRSIYNGEPRSRHSGADFPSPAGEPIKAPGAGRVVLAADRYFTGNTVVIDHGLGMFSLLAHMSDIGVRAGDVVARGDIVGAVGATGRVTGPHLHWTVRVNGVSVDPVSLVSVLRQVH